MTDSTTTEAEDWLDAELQESFVDGCNYEREEILKTLRQKQYHNILFDDIHRDCYTCRIIALIMEREEE